MDANDRAAIKCLSHHRRSDVNRSSKFSNKIAFNTSHLDRKYFCSMSIVMAYHRFEALLLQNSLKHNNLHILELGAMPGSFKVQNLETGI